MFPVEPYLLSYEAPGGSDFNESTSNREDLSLILGSGRSSEEWNGNPLEYFCLGNPMDRGARRAKSMQ